MTKEQFTAQVLECEDMLYKVAMGMLRNDADAEEVPLAGTAERQAEPPDGERCLHAAHSSRPRTRPQQ